MEKSPVTVRNEKLANTVVAALKKRFFGAHYCETKEEAVDLALSLIPEGSVIGWGGSVTIEQTGLKARIIEKGFTVIDRDKAKSPEERNEMNRQVLLSDTFLMSANAISEDGQLFNIDSIGNRVAALAFGPKQVIVMAGINKVARSVKEAELRAQTTAGPINASRLEPSTPCLTTGVCSECQSQSTLCVQFLRTRICKPEGRIQVILIGEELGF